MIKKILITTGGTGGHIISGLTIAKNLISLGKIVTWVGTKYRLESDIVSKNNIEIDYLDLRNFNDIFYFKKIIFPFKFLKCIFKAKKIIEARNPDIILGMGNYISIPICIAGWLKNIPIIIHEQNSIVGLSNKILYFISKKFLLGFNNKKINKNFIFVGNPIRKEIINIPHPKIRLKNRKGPIRILILGGSQGSYFINNIIPKVVKNINKDILIWHQTGKGNYKYVYNLYYMNYDKLYSINEFILNIHKAYIWSDLIICRSGALTVSEVSFIGIPALFIPLNSRDNHQYFNALFLEKIGAAKIFNQNNFNINLISNFILKLNRKILLKMSIKSKKYCINNSIDKIINEILNVYEN